jgi:hypothetical protein
MSGSGQTQPFGDVGSISGLLENGHGWVIYEYEPLVLRTWSFSSAAALPALSYAGGSG